MRRTIRRTIRFTAGVIGAVMCLSLAACGGKHSAPAVAEGVSKTQTSARGEETEPEGSGYGDKESTAGDAAGAGNAANGTDGTGAEKKTDATDNREGEKTNASGNQAEGKTDASGNHTGDKTEPSGNRTEDGTGANDKESVVGSTGDGRGTAAEGAAKPQSPTKPQSSSPAEEQTTKPEASETPKPTKPAAQPTTQPQEKPTAAPVPSGGDFSKTAIEVARAMGDGINLGNTMEATAGGNPWFDVSNVTNWETAWGQPKTTRAIIDGMKNAGFESIRIPIAWSNMMAKDGTYKIPQVFFDRIDEIIGYAYANNMYVIINIHYDDGWWDDFAKDEAGTMKRYKAMWSQIAGHYKDYNDKLIFESANEELGDTLGYALVNRINQAFVDLVRASGGNNGVRYLLIAGYNTDIDKTCKADFQMPADSCAGHLLISVHYYTPWPYCGMWKDESWGRADYDWGTAADLAEMEKYFKKMQKFTDAGYGVVIGEYSALPNYSNGSYTRKDGSLEFLSAVRRLSAKYGYAAYLWDTGDWYNKSACAMRWADTASLYR